MIYGLKMIILNIGNIHFQRKYSFLPLFIIYIPPLLPNLTTLFLYLPNTAQFTSTLKEPSGNRSF